MKELSYEEVLRLPVGSKVLCKLTSVKTVEGEVFTKDESSYGEKVGKIRYKSGVTHKETGEELYSYLNVWNSTKGTGIFEINMNNK